MKIRLYGGSRHGDIIDVRADDSGAPFMDSVDVNSKVVSKLYELLPALPGVKLDIK